jgi:hypothetical protein
MKQRRTSSPRALLVQERIAAEAGATAIMSLQSDVCLEALVIDYAPIRQRALELGVLPVRVPVLDFSLTDQTAMLPEAVRMVSRRQRSVHGWLFRAEHLRD